MTDRKTPPVQRPQRPNRHMAAPAPNQMPREPSFRTQNYESYVGRSPSPPPGRAPQDTRRRSAPIIQSSSLEHMPPTRAGNAPSPLGLLEQDFSEGQSTLVLQGEREAPKAQLRARLSVISGEQVGEEYILNRELTKLGRALDNDIVLIDIAASRRHIELRRHARGFALKDLRSANGVSINGRRVLDDELYDGDVIEVGETRLRFETIGGQRQRPLEEEQDTDPGMSALPPTVARTRSDTYSEAQLRAPVPHRPPPLPHATVESPPPFMTPPTRPNLSGASPAPPPSIITPSGSSPVGGGFGGSVDSATIEQLATPHPYTPAQPQLPFSPPTWGEEGEDMIELEPIPEVPEENLGGKPKAQNPWKTMGLGGLNAKDLGFQAPEEPWTERWSDQLIALWDDLMLRTGLDRVPAQTLITVTLSLIMSLVLGLYIGRLNQPGSTELSASIQASISRGDLAEAEALLKRAQGSLTPEEYQPLQEYVRLQAQYVAARKAFKEACDQERWEDGLKIIFEQLPADDPEVLSLAEPIGKIKRHVIQVTLERAYQKLGRGMLKSSFAEIKAAEHLIDEPRFKISDAQSLLSQARSLSLALALHKTRMMGAEGGVLRDASPSEQQVLEDAARLTQQGQLQKAERLLRGAMPSRNAQVRRMIFKVRLDAIRRLKNNKGRAKRAKQSYEQYILEEGDTYLLAQAQGDQLLKAFMLYFNATSNAIKRSNYEQVARWLHYAQILAPNNPQAIELHQRLTDKAKEWLERSIKEKERGQDKSAKLLLRSAIFFLEGDLKFKAQSLLNSIR